ncbi:unnamed protein product [Lupinus luteus]|uniref:Uncharacterized protein n=1 Tax=Lupinus luteus TaxID=3873 RepID=A0AAV1WFQ4_LUPLU
MRMRGYGVRGKKFQLSATASSEESLSQGKQINKEQEEVLRSKPSVLALIDELEKLRQPLQTALTEELNAVFTYSNRQPPSL